MQRHYVQLEIIKNLLKDTEVSFTDLNTIGLTNDHFNFHIKQLLKEGFIEKAENGYRLTTSGVEMGGRLDIETAMLISQPKISITLGIFRNNDTEVLVLKRTREQSKDKYAWLDRKLRVGNSAEVEIQNLLQEETALISKNYTFSGATHVIRKKNNNLEIDTVLLNFKVSDPEGELKSESKDGINSWMKVDEVKNISSDEKLIGFDERLEAYLQNNIIFQEFIN